jgi:ABC-type Mn2+/Zn2+ transport system ATPase subunit
VSALVTTSGLRGGYVSGVDAISEVDLHVEAGQIVAVLGPNGGGKTSFFRALLGELPRREGAVEISGRVAYVPQTERARLDFPVSALDVAAMGTYADAPWYRRLPVESRRRAEEALELVGLDAEASTLFGELSGGQRQRVLIARALAREARVLLLDEPLGGLDRASASRVGHVLAELRATGRAILVATHDINDAQEADRVLCINRRQIAYGPPAVLDAQTLERTYGGELITLPGGGQAVVVQHHTH